TFEDLTNRTAERLEAEIVGCGQRPDVEEILHSAVANTQHHHRLELLRDDSFWRVATDDGRIEGKKNRERELRRWRFDKIAETDIDRARRQGLRARALRRLRIQRPPGFSRRGCLQGRRRFRRPPIPRRSREYDERPRRLRDCRNREDPRPASDGAVSRPRQRTSSPFSESSITFDEPRRQ